MAGKHDTDSVLAKALETALKALGFNPVQLRWRMRRLAAGLSRRWWALENPRRILAYRHKVCGSCGLPVDHAARRCPRCDQRLPGAWTTRLQRVGRVLFPEGTYLVTGAILALNVALYVAMEMQTAATGAGWTGSVAPAQLLRFGAWHLGLLEQGELWRLVTPIFLHGDILHLIFNCLWLIQLGPFLEETFGRSRFLFLYLTSGVAGFLCSVGWRFVSGAGRTDFGIGASGAVFGLIAASLVLGYVRRLPETNHYRGHVLRWSIFALILSFLPGIDLLAHLGGAAGGGSLALVLRHGRQLAGPWAWIWHILALLCLLALVAAFAAVALRPPPFFSR
jgi:membrane associated rhomboid family serine protease